MVTRAETHQKALENGHDGQITLNAVERLAVLSILPRQGDVLSLKVIRDLQEDLGLTETEIKEIGAKNNPDGGISFNPAKAMEKTKTLPIGDQARAVILEAADELSKQKKFPMELLALFEFLDAERQKKAREV